MMKVTYQLTCDHEGCKNCSPEFPQDFLADDWAEENGWGFTTTPMQDFCSLHKPKE